MNTYFTGVPRSDYGWLIFWRKNANGEASRENFHVALRTEMYYKLLGTEISWSGSSNEKILNRNKILKAHKLFTCEGL